MVTRGQAAVVLRNLGWGAFASAHCTQAIMDFQRGYNLGPALKIDGTLGPATSAALLKSEARRRAGLGTASAHFSYSEFLCTCGGRYKNCRRVWMTRRQIQAMEKYRLLSGPLTIISGCRCVDRNKIVGGARNSQHLYGTACDVKPRFSLSKIRSLNIFTGVGVGARSHRMCHGDTRPGIKITWKYPGW